MLKGVGARHCAKGAGGECGWGREGGGEGQAKAVARMMWMTPASWGMISPLKPLMSNSSSTLVTLHRGAPAGPVPREEEEDEERIVGLEMGTVAA
jgi:hypothetical protein